nr:hypothetical protein [uncultured Kingella sp.]
MTTWFETQDGVNKKSSLKKRICIAADGGRRFFCWRCGNLRRGQQKNACEHSYHHVLPA